jgi:ferritin
MKLIDILENRTAKQAEESITTPAPEENKTDPKAGMPLKGKVLDLVNDQYRFEVESSEVYYAMSAYFADIKLEGFASYFRKAAEEERLHAMKFFDYMIKCNVLIEMKGFTPAKTRFENPKTACDFFLTHEQDVTRSINAIADAAMASKDFYTFEFIQWFLCEQLEEVRKAEDLSKKMALVKDNMAGLLLLDQQLKG